MPEGLALALSLTGLAATLAVAITRPPWLPEAVVAIAAAAGLVAVGAVSVNHARQALGHLAPTIGFLLRAEDTDVHLGEYLRLGAATVPAAIAASTLMLWSGVKFGL